MLGLLIFDHLNDVLYINGNPEFVNHVRASAASQGLWSAQAFSEDSEQDSDIQQDEQLYNTRKDDSYLDADVVIQLFSPLVTSQRVMTTQFNNSYSTIFCEDGTCMVFKEYSGYLFLGIGTQCEMFLQRYISVSVQLVKLTVGPCITMLKNHREKSRLLDKLLSAWLEIYSNEQSYLVEAMERLVVNQEIAVTAMNMLSTVLKKLKKCKDIEPRHDMFLIGSKLLSLYSGEEVEDMSGSDLLLLNLLAQANSMKTESTCFLNLPASAEVKSPIPEDVISELESADEEEVSEDVHSDLSPDPTVRGQEHEFDIKSYILLLKTSESQLTPHAVYFYPVANDWSMIVTAQVKHSLISSELLKIMNLLDYVRNEERKSTDATFISNIDLMVKRTQSLAKKLPKLIALKVRGKLLQVSSQWESLKNCNLEEYLRSPEGTQLPTRIEACLSALYEAANSAFRTTCFELEFPNGTFSLKLALRDIKENIEELSPFLEPKILRNMSLGTCSVISVNKYLEEFPGLVHFLYIDRTVHQLTAPTLWTVEQHRELAAKTDLADEAANIRQLTAAKIWSVVDFARDHLAKGHTSIIWKDKTFSYSYFLWFEDRSGNPLKPVTLDEEFLEGLPIPGIICGDFYEQFASKALPNSDTKSVKIYELFCIHLGLTTSPCILEQTRRLAATVWEIAGPATANPLDLL